VPVTETIRALRISLSTLGDGFVEAIPGSALERLAEEQCRRTPPVELGRGRRRVTGSGPVGSEQAEHDDQHEQAEQTEREHASPAGCGGGIAAHWIV